MATTFDVIFLGNLAIIDPVQSNRSLDTMAVESWLGTYGSISKPLVWSINPRSFPGDTFAGDNAVSSGRVTVDGVQEIHDATMVFDAMITFGNGVTEPITAVVVRSSNGDVYFIPELSYGAAQAAIKAAPIRSLTLNAPVYSNRYSTGVELAANRSVPDMAPCVAKGTKIATSVGAMPVENLKSGDLVMTRDSGLQPVRWVGRRNLMAGDLSRHPDWAPVRIPAGTLGAGNPQEDLLVSPNHRILITNNRATLYVGEAEVLVAASHLLGVPGIHRCPMDQVSYFQVLFDQHEVILSNGAWTESFQPSALSLGAIDAAQRAEVLALFPELQHGSTTGSWRSARRVAKAHEARLLTG